MAKKEIVPSDAFDWLEMAMDEYLPFIVELDPTLHGWAHYATLICNRKWRLRDKHVLCFENREDAQAMYERWGITFSHYKVTGEKDTKIRLKDGKNQIVENLQITNMPQQDKTQIETKDSFHTWERQSIAYQMHCVQYTHDEIAEELGYANKHYIQQVINYVRKQKYHQDIDYARMYRDENLSYLSEAKIALINHMRKIGFEEKPQLISIFLQIVKEENLIAGAYSPEKLQILSSNNIENMTNQELMKTMYEVLAENNIIDAEENDRDK